jgi:hypothetical protein
MKQFGDPRRTITPLKRGVNETTTIIAISNETLPTAAEILPIPRYRSLETLNQKL